MNKKIEKPWWQPALIMFFELSGWIAIPVIAAMFLGTWLDKKYGTEPWLYLISVAMAFVISIIGIVQGARKAIKQMELSTKKDEKSTVVADEKINK